ncbi:MULTISPECIES: type III secretion protein [Pseudomonas]|uniref:Type III secretion effector protein n=2 Tax=Pseudomonas TaxID=286 RepID=A0A0D0T7X6_PSEFL|nr:MULTISPECIES: type III secretion protein [Pseudomonas fluorescens group]AZE60394.1 hypothetical protein C4K02_2031 [Pseudomonas synxantha]KIR19791.1 hypothetical protein PFLU3_47830 [Pseudomonas fluorescens]
MSIDGVLPPGRSLAPGVPVTQPMAPPSVDNAGAWGETPSERATGGLRKPFLLRGALSALRHRNLQNLPMERAQFSPPGPNYTDKQLAGALEKTFGLLHPYLNDGRLTWLSLQRIAAEPTGKNEELDAAIQVVREILERPRLSDTIFSRDGDITRDSLRAAARALQGNSSPSVFSQDPFHAQGNAEVVEALQAQFEHLRDKTKDRTFLFEQHQYVDIAKLKAVMQDPYEVDQQGNPVLDPSTGMPRSKYSELCVYTAKNIVERPGLLPALEHANTPRLFGPPHVEGHLCDKNLERWQEQQKARKAR